MGGLPLAKGRVRVTFDGGRLTSDAGVLVLADIERRLGIAERLARCLTDPRAPERVHHTLAEMIRFRVLLIAAGYPDANDCDALRSDPAFKMAVGRPPESGRALCSQPTMCRLENLPGPVALKRMMAAMVELFCDSFEQVPRRIVLDIDDTEDPVHGRQELALFHAHYGGRCFLPTHVYEATTGKPVAVILRPGKTPDGAEVALVLRHVIRAIRKR
jgi:Transposase DDE domain group 1